MNPEYLSLWCEDAEVTGEHELQLAIRICKISPAPGFRLNSHAATYFLQRGCLPIADWYGTQIGRMLEAFQQDKFDPTVFVARIRIEQPEFWEELRGRMKALRCGAWAYAEHDVHAKTGADQISIVQPGIETLVLWFQERSAVARRVQPLRQAA